MASIGENLFPTKSKSTRQEMLQKRCEEEKNKIVRMVVKDLYRQGYSSKRISEEIGIAKKYCLEVHQIRRQNDSWIRRYEQKK